MREVFDHFGNLELWLAADNVKNVIIGNAYVKVIADFIEKNVGSGRVVQDLEFPCQAMIIKEKGQSFKNCEVFFFTGEDKFSLEELLFQILNFILKLLLTLQEEVVNIIEDNDHGLVPDLVHAVFVEGVAQDGHLVELVPEHVSILYIEQIHKEVDLKHSTLNQVSR